MIPWIRRLNRPYLCRGRAIFELSTFVNGIKGPHFVDRKPVKEGERMIQGYVQSLVYQSVQRYNILPLTSACSQACIFCSHNFNPPGVESFSIDHLPKGVIIDLLDYLDPGKPVVIGESSTRIEEGEPFLHPRWRVILRNLRKKYSETLIKITTSGVTLHKKDISLLERLKPLRLCISVNMLEPDLRRRYLGDGEPEKLPKILEKLGETDLELEGSIVMLPEITGFQEIAKTLNFLNSIDNFKLIRLFKPGYTSRVSSKLKEMLAVDSLFLQKHIAGLRSRLDLPLIYESAEINDLKPEVTGVIKNSPAEMAGIKAGDILLEIDGDKPFSRVDAFHRFQKLIQQKKVFTVSLNRAGEKIKVQVTAGEKGKDDMPGRDWCYCGLVMNYDFSPGQFQTLKSRVGESRADRILLVTARGAAGRFAPVLERLRSESRTSIELAAVTPEFFGGSINCAGLLVLRDIKNKLREVKDEFDPGLVILPDISFDDRGRDLLGERITDLAEELDLLVETI